MTAAITFTFGGTWTTSANVLSFSMSAGRQNATDTYGAANGEIVFRRVAGNTANLDAIVPGTEVEVPNANCIFKVTDVINDYGMTTTMDTVTITFEGGLADANRANLNGYNAASADLATLFFDVMNEANVTAALSTLNNPDCDGTTVYSVADWVQQLATTIDGRIDDSGGGVLLYDKYNFTVFESGGDALVFSDGTVALGSGNIRISYDQIVFTSLGENYYTQVVIDPESHAAQTSTAAGATAPYRVLQLNTFNANTGQAQDYADYLVSLYSDPTHKRVSSVSVNGTSTNASLLFGVLGQTAISYLCRIIFRGTTYNAVIEGWSYTATPEDDRYTFYFSGADLNNFLILDDADRGVLDANRLGY